MTDPRVSFAVGDILNRIEAKIDRIDERTRLLELGAATSAAVEAAVARAKASARRSRLAVWTAIIALITAAAAVGTLFAH